MELAYSFCNSSAIVSFIFLVIVFYRFLFNRSSSLRLPPSPPSLPILGHSHLLLGSSPHSALQKLSIRYGPLMHLRIGSVPVVVASSPAHAREFLKVHGSSFTSRPHITLLDILLYGNADFAFAPVGPLWKLMRKTCMVELFSGRQLQHFHSVRQQEISRFLHAMAASTGKLVDMTAKLGELTGNILVRMATGRRMERAQRVLGLVQEASEMGGQFYLGDYFRFMGKWDVQGYKEKCRDIHERLDSLMEEVMKEHQSRRLERTMEEDNDIIDVLMECMKEEKENGGIGTENIKSLILDVFFAGIHTASLPLQFGLAELLRHPPILLKAQAEIDLVVGKTRLVEETDLAHLPYLEAIVKETLRLHPPVPMVPRAGTVDCQVGKYDIPANTWVFVNVWAMGKDPHLWDSPSEFRPERFLNSRVDVKGQDFELLPFGSGLRMCPGSGHALLVFRIVLASLIQCFHWEVDGGVERLEVEERAGGMTVSMANKLIFRPIPRFDPLIS